MIRLKFRGGALRSATIVAAATMALGASSALASNLQKAKPSNSPHGAASAGPSEKLSPKPSGTPAVKPTDTPSTAHDQPAPAVPAPKTSPSGSGDTHGDCVSKVADDPKAKAANKHGKMTHGAAVSNAAHTCPKGKDDGQGSDANDTEKPDAPEAAETPDPAETPDAAESSSSNPGD